MKIKCPKCKENAELTPEGDVADYTNEENRNPEEQST